MKGRLLVILFASIGAVLVAYGACWWEFCSPAKTITCEPLERIASFYATNLRGSLFTGFLTLGGFLLSLKAFIVVNMKKEVFDTATYQNLWKERVRLDKKNTGTQYQPLAELSELLHYAILSCVLTSASQFTIGLFGTVLSTMFCLWAALLSILLLLMCLWAIRQNLSYMFKHLESTAESPKAADAVPASAQPPSHAPNSEAALKS